MLMEMLDGEALRVGTLVNPWLRRVGMSVQFMSDLLQQECRYLLGDTQEVPDAFPFFVEPIVDDKLALTKLGTWLTGTPTESSQLSPADQYLAVLLAPAGVGKTSVSREVIRSLQSTRNSSVFPLLIESRQWSSLNPHEPLTVWTLIRNALNFNGYAVVPQEAFELFAQAGCIAMIFDGLDEVASIRSGAIRPVDIIMKLRELAEESDFRILLTSRDGLWTEMIPDNIRNEVHEFHLIPFRKPQIADSGSASLCTKQGAVFIRRHSPSGYKGGPSRRDGKNAVGRANSSRAVNTPFGRY
jgi:hypothetical protein